MIMADDKKPAKAATEKKSPAKKVADVVKAPAAAKPAGVATPPAVHVRGPKRALEGVVRSDKMDKTVVVEVVSLRRDPVYGKYLKDRTRYHAHDEKNEFHPGDKVEIQEHRPLSRHKRWIVSRLIERAKVE
jgi:small subunit ribosomal protein S17